MNIQVLLVDDHTLVRQGIRKVVEEDESIEVVGEADNGRTAVEMARGLRPDVILMDLSMPEMSGIEATRMLNTEQIPHRTIILSMHSSHRFVSESLGAGAKGYVLKDCAAEELIGAIRSVAANCVYLSPRVAGVIAQDYEQRLASRGTSPVAALSARERQVLQLLSEGKNTKEIAYALKVSMKTVETHRSNIMKKTGCRTVADLIRYAIREGISHL